MTKSENEPNEARDEAVENAAELVVPVTDDDARLRALIGSELDRQYALPVARRTLELLIEANVEPASGDPGYRIVDRAGDTRLRPIKPEQAKKGATGDAPLTLPEFVDEVRARHPDLFGTAPPEPEPAPDAHDTLQDKVAHVKAVSARFVETQSAFAKTLATNSAERGRALAAVAGETVGSWRSRIDTHLKARGPAEPERIADDRPPDTVPDRSSPPARSEAALGQHELEISTETAAGRFQADSDSQADAQPSGSARGSDAPASHRTGFSFGSGRRRSYALALTGLAALALLAIVLRPGRQDGDGASPDAAKLRQQAEGQPGPSSQTSETAPKPAPAPIQNAAPANPPADPEEQPDDASVRAPNEIAGVAEVIDTATLRIAGKVVHLFGVEWVRGGQAEELAKYLARRPVSCQPAPGSKAHLCSVNGRDLSEVVLFNGGGRASPEAGPELVAAEDHARSERLGVWKR